MHRTLTIIPAAFAATLAVVTPVQAQSGPPPGSGAILRSETRTINRATQEQTRDRLQRTGIANEGASVRATPAVDGVIIGRLPKGARVVIAGMDEGWYRLELGSREGFVAAGDLRVR